MEQAMMKTQIPGVTEGDFMSSMDFPGRLEVHCRSKLFPTISVVSGTKVSVRGNYNCALPVVVVGNSVYLDEVVRAVLMLDGLYVSPQTPLYGNVICVFGGDKPEEISVDIVSL